MELKLVYRSLRQISDWALRFYSDVYVEGEENVPEHGPLIITSCHHNEILDVATLSISIPHGRPVCIWGKSTLFKNPIVRQVLLSSGAIPVARNPNATPPSESATPSDRGNPPHSHANDALFRDTFKALERGEAIGVFPEGTSYTEPGIAQVKDGASRAALGYVKWVREGKGKGKKLLIVPVGIVYTDKSQYQSAVRVGWGKPLDVAAFVEDVREKSGDENEEEDSREVTKALSAEIEKRMLALTINAPDWDTLFAAEMARDILWASEPLQPQEFVPVSQNLITLFSDKNAAPSQVKARQALLKYHALLEYTNMSHASLIDLLPDISMRPVASSAMLLVVHQVLRTVLHPRFVLFLPVLPLHIPAYVTGLVASRVLSTPGEEETRAQFKAVFGGLAATAVYASLTRVIVSRVVANLSRAHIDVPEAFSPLFDILVKGGRWFFVDQGQFPKVRSTAGFFGSFYITAYVVSHWHNYFVKSNYAQFKRLVASVKLCLGALSPASGSLKGAALAPYTTNEIPPPNPYIRRREGQTAPVHIPPAPPVPSRVLIRPLLDARMDATRAMWSFLADSKYLNGLVTAKMKGEAWMQVGPVKR
ncbi:glycerol-3-phosphate-1-acyltransferase [Epithele typhae]|uniref:glycerol-3-phosphate-1-acyltransferase n=1 Tax=Epithele typhae TaxID=378194 RepID=UPI00200769CC|nr:glycerol-3-phosphate-1-acyltransferase [Epithele typhae]KAH9920018.1 glycerol-3-phosphate-1-acyltransferase [Epithele typhae]